MINNKKLVIFLLIFPFTLNIAQENPAVRGKFANDLIQHYKKYPIGEIRAIAGEVDRDTVSTLGRLQLLLNRFYSEYPRSNTFQSDIQLDATYDRQTSPDYNVTPATDAALQKLREKQIPRFVKNAPNIFELHHSMGLGLMKAEEYGIVFTKNPVRAAYHLLAAFQYRSLKLTPETWTDPDRLDLLDNATEKADASRYQAVRNELVKARRDLAELKKKHAAEEDNQVRNLKDPGINEPLVSQNRETVRLARENISKLESKMAEETKVFEKYAAEYDRYSANCLLEIAGIVRKIDNNLRDREKILNDREYYRTSFNQTFYQHWKLESRLSSWINYMEMASLLDPRNSLTPYDLGVEYNRKSDRLMAISNLEKALKIHESGSPLPQDKLVELYRLLGGLYYSEKRYLDAAWFYRLKIKTADDPDTRMQLAKIYAENTGDYPAAAEVLESLPVNEPDSEGDPESLARKLKGRYEIYMLLVTIHEKSGNSRELVTVLEKAAGIHGKLESILHEGYDLLYENEKTLREARTGLNITPNEQALQKYYSAENIYSTRKQTLQNIESLRKSLNLRKIYFTLAREREKNHNISGAIEAYRTAEASGIDPDEARREILRLEGKTR